MISTARSLALFGAALLIAAVASAAGGIAPAHAADVLILCANEGQTCVAPNAQTTITFGKNGAVKTTVGVTQIDCSNGSFGGDPLKGENKACTYSVNPDSKTWTQCAEEGKDCTFTGAKLVRYGAAPLWVYGSYVNGVSCKNGTFGDPARGTDKTCQVAN
ncbi:MAG: hypothetical protein K9G60_00475 [Pseudolabrys sp.]|nr:hypothetical protein [Pseudolabrys sp.]